MPPRNDPTREQDLAITSSGDSLHVMTTLKTASAVLKALHRVGDARTADSLQRYFKTGPGEYGEGDRFIGLKVPAYRSISKHSRGLPPEEIKALLASPWHEARAVGLDLLCQLSRADDSAANIKKWATFYWAHRKGVNNWDLVDLSAPTVMGRWLKLENEKSPDRAKAWITKTAARKSLWDRRIAVLATSALIREGRFELTLLASSLLLKDPEDLIHKATGWMLREMGKKSARPLDLFLKKHAHEMPRTMLRYAIEKKSPEERARWMRQKEDFRNSGRSQ